MLTNITKTVAAALIIASASLALVSNGHAKPQKTQFDAEKVWMDRASQNVDGGG